MTNSRSASLYSTTSAISNLSDGFRSADSVEEKVQYMLNNGFEYYVNSDQAAIEAKFELLQTDRNRLVGRLLFVCAFMTEKETMIKINE